MARSNAPRLVQTLLSAKAAADDVDACGWTPLMWAALHGDADTCKVLLVGGASVNKISLDGSSALFCGAQADVGDPLRVVTLLLEFQANPSNLIHMHVHFDTDIQQALDWARQLHARTSHSITSVGKKICNQL